MLCFSERTTHSAWWLVRSLQRMHHQVLLTLTLACIRWSDGGKLQRLTKKKKHRLHFIASLRGAALWSIWHHRHRWQNQFHSEKFRKQLPSVITLQFLIWTFKFCLARVATINYTVMNRVVIIKTRSKNNNTKVRCVICVPPLKLCRRRNRELEKNLRLATFVINLIIIIIIILPASCLCCAAWAHSAAEGVSFTGSSRWPALVSPWSHTPYLLYRHMACMLMRHRTTRARRPASRYLREGREKKKIPLMPLTRMWHRCTAGLISGAKSRFHPLLGSVSSCCFDLLPSGAKMNRGAEEPRRPGPAHGVLPLTQRSRWSVYRNPLDLFRTSVRKITQRKCVWGGY